MIKKEEIKKTFKSKIFLWPQDFILVTVVAIVVGTTLVVVFLVNNVSNDVAVLVVNFPNDVVVVVVMALKVVVIYMKLRL